MRFLALALAVISLGCSQRPNIVGTWNSGLNGALTTYHFRSDGTFNFEVLTAGCRGLVSGKYKFVGQQLELDPENAHVDGPQPVAGDMQASLNQVSRVTMQMQSPATFRLGLEEPPLILHKMSPNP